jgi:hypothetical protein
MMGFGERVEGSRRGKSAAELANMEVMNGLRKLAKAAEQPQPWGGAQQPWDGSAQQRGGGGLAFRGNQYSDVKIDPLDASFITSPILSNDLRSAIVARAAGRPAFVDDAMWRESGHELRDKLDALLDELGEPAALKPIAAMHRVLDAVDGPMGRTRASGRPISTETLTNAARIGKALFFDHDTSSLGPVPDRSRAEPARAHAHRQIAKALGFGPPADDHVWQEMAKWLEPAETAALRKFHDISGSSYRKGRDPYGREPPEHLEAIDNTTDASLRSAMLKMRRRLADATPAQRHQILDSVEMAALARGIRRAARLGKLGGSLADVAAGLLSQ